MDPMSATSDRSAAIERSAVDASAHPPCAVSHIGVVKWWKVTTGWIPASWHAAQTRR